MKDVAYWAEQVKRVHEHADRVEYLYQDATKKEEFFRQEANKAKKEAAIARQQAQDAQEDACEAWKEAKEARRLANEAQTALQMERKDAMLMFERVQKAERAAQKAKALYKKSLEESVSLKSRLISQEAMERKVEELDFVVESSLQENERLCKEMQVLIAKNKEADKFTSCLLVICKARGIDIESDPVFQALAKNMGIQ